MIRLRYCINPMGSVRTTQRQKFKDERAIRYRNYKTFIGLETKKQYKGPLLTGPIMVNVVFIMPIPESWSQKKKDAMVGQYVTVKPDIDNILKGLFDSINKIIWQDDNQVVITHMSKIYGLNPGIELEVVEIGGEKNQATPQEETQ